MDKCAPAVKNESPKQISRSQATVSCLKLKHKDIDSLMTILMQSAYFDYNLSVY